MKSVCQAVLDCACHSVTKRVGYLNRFVCDWMVYMILKELLHCCDITSRPPETILKTPQQTTPGKSLDLSNGRAAVILDGV